MASRAAIGAVWILSGLILCAPMAGAQNNAITAEAVKAAYLYNFGSYVEWPEDALPGDDVTIGVVGADTVVRELRTLLPGRTIQDRQVRLREVQPSSPLRGVHILYIGNVAPELLEKLVEAARQHSVLVITDVPDGIQRGGMINFVMQDRRVRFEISRGAAERAGLKLSSRLLAVALRVHSSGLPLEIVPAGIGIARVSPR